MGKLFGTDGIRGVTNKHPMTSDMALRIGQSLAYILKRRGHKTRILIGKDTRLSGYMLESALTTGICSMGADVVLVGPVPTPAIAFLTNNMDADAGVVISASHNPYQDNGIKIFSNSGFKLNDEQENMIEKLVFSDKLHRKLSTAKKIGKALRIDNALGRYIVFLRSTLSKNMSLSGIKIALDCANGATYKVAPTIFKEMRADLITANINPNGININHNSGSLFPKVISDTVLSKRADIGLAFDGDGDRLIAADEKGRVVSGDKIIAICAKHLKETNKLKNNIIVTTPMSNAGLTEALNKMDIKRAEAPIGDRYVLEKMLDTGAILGGENSGHIIFIEHHTTGDGILSALQLLKIMNKTQKPLSELADIMKIYPQVTENIHIKNKTDINSIDALRDTIQEVENDLNENGRVLVRYSGTQPLLRIMVEGETEEKAQQSLKKISSIARKELV
jgi:phosphoglucosamine mutase